MKILFTSVGRRVELIQAFRNAGLKCAVDLYIVGGDASFSAPALQFCDEAIMLPLIKDSEYIPFLVNYCRENHVDVLIPTIDTDLLLLSEHREEFCDTRVVISSPDKIRICRDKRLTTDFFLNIGLNSPLSIDDINKYSNGFPAFIKPRDGSSSINAFKVNNIDELSALTKIVPDYIIQPFIKGVEYTIDVFCDFEGNPIFITPRIRLDVRSGEVLRTKIVNDKTIIEETKRIVAQIKPCGAITIQMIRDEKSGDDYFVEINPRFGGGAPLSIKAGADSAEAMLRLLLGLEIKYKENAAEENAIYSRYDQSVRVD